MQADYNSVIDFLEEEHCRRDVFTTAIETKNLISDVSNSCSESMFSSTRKLANFEEFSSDTKELH
jgi:hypothetical protein